MKPQPQVVIAEDPAGLDKLLLAAGKGIARYLESAIGMKIGRPVSLWDGPDGLGAILQEHIEAAGVPNKRLPELVTPRSTINALNQTLNGTLINLKRPKTRRRKVLR